MRPIQLQIAGLQSYREAQEIDFTALTGAGVFGIFGPTGSGKSTLLDAITLALFGKVERAPGGTQAIMNQAEQTLSVSFTFELGSANGAMRYRVDRQFKRNGEVSVLGSLCRLIQYRDGESLVLADKAGEVNQHIQEILGLSMADFTRAVVLPQGKFAEFLTLAGKDRRAMLQRLFHLEPYGDRLSGKTSGRHKETDAAIKELQAEQQGLGDASELALAQAETRLSEARSAAGVLRERLAACELRAAELRTVRELQRERATVAARQAAQAAQAPHVAALAGRLARAAQAERLRPLVRRLAAAEVQLAQQRSAAAAAAQALGDAQGALAQAQAAQAAAREALAAQEAPLAARLEQLRQAAALAAELAQSRERLAALAAEAELRQAELAGLRAEQARETELREKALQRQAQLKDELKLVEVSSAYRERLQEALQEKRELDRLAKQNGEQHAELASRQIELEQLRKSLETLGQTEREWAGRGAAWFERLSSLHTACHQTEQKLSAMQGKIPEQIVRLKSMQKQAELTAMAEVLAIHLHEGEACLVCGSSVHPKPVLERGGLSTAESRDNIQDEAVAQLERQQDEARGRQLDLRQQLHALQSMEQQWRLASDDEGRQGEGDMLFAQNEAAAALADSFTEGTPISTEQLRLVLDMSTKELELGRQEAQELQQALQTLLQEKKQLVKQRHDLGAREHTARSLYDSGSHKAAETLRSLQTLGTGWSDRFPDFKPEDVAGLAERLKQQDQQADELKGRLEKSVEFLSAKHARIEQLQQELGDQEKQEIRIAAEQRALQQQVDVQAERLHAWVGSEDAGRLASETQAKLNALRTEEQRTTKQLEASQSGYQAAASSEAAVRQAEESARLAFEESEREWVQQSSEEGFSTVKEVTDALISPEQQRQWSSEVEEHGKLEHQLASRLAELDLELAGRAVTDEAWTEVERELSQCKAEDEAALQTTAKAERDWEDLQAKHQRWRELESKQASYRSELALLGKLQSVLRGNAFVEYLAEEQLMHVSRSASDRLGQLTRQKYAIEVDSGGGFVIRDDANGGVRRPVTTLSGGETFLTSLSLALALSTQIQLKGEHPLEFFFLDEGFGTLDQELLDTVITALEKLHTDKLTVGVISHVPELRARLPRRLIVYPPEPGGQGSRISLETM
ncbi:MULTISPECIES: SMC family ATPase [unclassified Paenibacillus]|uniref:AAA family ATPase n=1 Tax=unclassified Paenibacillus TaxID=185978 RepID=UPI001AEA3B7F|nr:MULTISPECIES: SMC family ATPase [unclassified Paenibacillus]MBP1156340.1 exonuclease SbcC [Paenibacillus sp. PvP091]MBP1168274.1 exonuclease SbcC [Paenibacillus sp. PvR098]MBP2439302.1 exonuclease SbcC [Paenibacillus sp. PvP052]